MIFEETEESKNFEIVHHDLINSVETLRNIIYFVKHYSELTKTYLEQLTNLIQTIKPKLSNSKKNSIISLNIANKLVKIIDYQTDSLKEISNFHDSGNSYANNVNQIITLASKYSDYFTQSKTNLYEDYKEIEKEKQFFFNEANKIEEILIKSKNHDRKLIRSKTKKVTKPLNIPKLNREVDISKTINPDVDDDFIFHKKVGIITQDNDFFNKSIQKLKTYKKQYLEKIDNFNTNYEKHKKYASSLIDYLIKQDQKCNNDIINYSLKLIMCIKSTNRITSLEIEDFVNKYSQGVDSLIENTIKKSFIINNPFPLMKEEPYEIKIIKNYDKLFQENKIKLAVSDVKDILNEFSEIILIKGNEFFASEQRLSDIEIIEYFINKLFFKDYRFFNLTIKEKGLLYKLLSQIKIRHIFLNKIHQIIKPEFKVLYPKQFKELADLFILILNESYKDNTYYLINLILKDLQNIFIINPTTGKKENILQKIKNCPLFNHDSFWHRILEQNIYNGIQENLSKGVSDNEITMSYFANIITEKVVFWSHTMKVVGISLENLQEILMKSLLQFNVREQTINNLNLFLQNLYPN